jgi:hypothetical protein
MMKNTLWFVLVISVIVSGCETMPEQTKSPLELHAIQSKEFEIGKKIAFAATLSVFQDLGYIVSSANLDTGLITAKSPTKQNFVPFVGQRMTDIKATAFVEEIVQNRTKVRLNYVNSSQTSSGYGMKGEREFPIETPEMYQDTFTKIQQAIFIRKNIN